MSSRGEYRSVHTVIVDGPDYQALSPAAKLVWWTLKMSCGIIGISVLPAVTSTLAERTGYDAPTVESALRELQNAGWVEAERNVVWIVRGLEFEPQVDVSDPKHRKAAQRRIEAMPNLPIVARFKARYAEWFDRPYPSPLEGPSKALRSKEPEHLPEPQPERNTKDGAAPSIRAIPDRLPAVGSLYGRIKPFLYGTDGEPERTAQNGDVQVLEQMRGAGRYTDEELEAAVKEVRRRADAGMLPHIHKGQRFGVKALKHRNEANVLFLDEMLSEVRRSEQRKRKPESTLRPLGDVMRRAGMPT